MQYVLVLSLPIEVDANLCVVKWKTIDSSMIYTYTFIYTYMCTLEVEAFSLFPIRAKFLPFLPFNKYKHT